MLCEITFEPTTENRQGNSCGNTRRHSYVIPHKFTTVERRKLAAIQYLLLIATAVACPLTTMECKEEQIVQITNIFNKDSSYYVLWA